MKRIEAINDFVVKFANVNGSGSASANEMFAKAILRMGVPVSPRNIFPSNIQGMPTWYEARVCEKGYHGRRGGVDMMVAMNPQTWDADVREVGTVTVRAEGELDVRVGQTVHVATLTQALAEVDPAERVLESYRFYVWNQATGQVRWMCSWDTTESDVDGILGVLEAALEG